MKIKSLHIDNYAPFDKCDLTLDEAAYLVIGQNNTDQQVSSNGAGKSCLIQAIVWALFGEVIRPGLKVDDIVGPLRSYVRVVIEFEKDGRQWKIDRARHYPGRKSNEPLVWIDGEDVTRHKKNDAFIQAQLGFTFDVFMFAGYSDAEHPPFCTLTPGNLLKAFGEVMELEKIDAAIATLKDKETGLSGAIKDLLEATYRIEERLSMARALAVRLEKRVDEFEDEKEAEILKLSLSLESAEVELHQLAETAKMKARYQEILQVINSELLVYEDKNKRLKVLKTEHSEISLKISKHEGLLKRIKSELDTKRKEWANLAENDSCECNYCGSTFKKEEGIRRASALMDEVEQISTKHIETEATMRSFTLKLEPIQKEISQLEEQLETFGQLHQDKHEVSMLLKDVDAAIKRGGEIKAVLIPRLKKELDTISTKSMAFEQEMLSAKLAEIEEMELERRQKEAQIADNEKRTKQLPSLVSRFRKIRETVMEDFLVSLEEEINANLVLMGTDIQAQIDLDWRMLRLSFTNGSKDGRFYPYSIFSRGERSKIDKACAVALNSVFGIGLYIDDEGLSGVDWEASKGLLDFLCNTEDTRLLVFHNERIQSSIDMKGVGKITVSKTEGRSYAKS